MQVWGSLGARNERPPAGPTLQALHQACSRQVRDFYGAHRRLRLQELEQRLKEIRHACPLTSDPAVVQSWAVVVPLWVE